MTDFFALLDQPRSPWLDPEQLKDVFHARTLEAHPDAQGSEVDFAQLNEAYQALRDPKRRLQHLLLLRGETPANHSASIPVEVAALFPFIARLTRQAESALDKSRAATSALQRSLVRPELIATRRELEEMRKRLQDQIDSANEQLRQLGNNAGAAELQDLYLRFSYLSRWTAELEEKLCSFELASSH